MEIDILCHQRYYISHNKNLLNLKGETFRAAQRSALGALLSLIYINNLQNIQVFHLYITLIYEKSMTYLSVMIGNLLFTLQIKTFCQQ